MYWIIGIPIAFVVFNLLFILCACKVAGDADRRAEKQFKIWQETRQDSFDI